MNGLKHEIDRGTATGLLLSLPRVGTACQRRKARGLASPSSSKWGCKIPTQTPAPLKGCREHTRLALRGMSGRNAMSVASARLLLSVGWSLSRATTRPTTTFRSESPGGPLIGLDLQPVATHLLHVQLLMLQEPSPGQGIANACESWG